MRKDYLGTINIDGSKNFIKFTSGICKTLKAESHDICAIECIKLMKRIDMENKCRTISDKTRQDKTRRLLSVA